LSLNATAVQPQADLRPVSPWDRPQHSPISTLQPKHLLVQTPVNKLAKCRSDQIKVDDKEKLLRRRLSEINALSWWKRFVGGLNKERDQLVQRLAALDAESATLAYEVKVGLRTIEAMLGADDEYVQQVKQAMGGMS
jgi:hypothetical protein